MLCNTPSFIYSLSFVGRTQTTYRGKFLPKNETDTDTPVTSSCCILILVYSRLFHVSKDGIWFGIEVYVGGIAARDDIADGQTVRKLEQIRRR